MKIPVIRHLASTHDLKALTEAAKKFEESRENSLHVAGEDDGEILTHLLLAIRIREKIDNGIPIMDAIRDESRGIQSLIGVAKKK